MKRRVKRLPVLFSFIVVSSFIHLEEVKADVSLTLTQSFVTRYIWRGQDLFADDDPAYQPSIDISFSNIWEQITLSLNLWASFPLSAGHEDVTELDYTISLSYHLNDNITLSFGYTYYDYPKANKSSDLQEPWINIDYQLAKGQIRISFFAGYDFNLTSSGPDEGWYFSSGLSWNIPAIAGLSFSITTWGTDGAQDLKPALIYAMELGLAKSFSFDKFSITPFLNYTISHEETINPEDEIWFGLEVSYVF